MSPRLTLADLLDGIAVPPHALADSGIAGLQLDSRAVVPGDAFVALAGARTHGLQHAAEALRRGATCVLFEPPASPAGPDSDRLVAVPQLRAQLGIIADRCYAQPSAQLHVTGVTGTNGKTSTVQLLAQAFDIAGRGPCGTIGTLGVGLGGELRAGERTTPDVASVHATLSELRSRGAHAVGMEVSSHALEQGRVDAVRFAIAVFTNLTRDHLDYHGTMEAYGAAKARLFGWPGLRAAVINSDDPFGRALAAQHAGTLDVWTVSAAGDAAARLRAEHVRLDAQGIAFDLVEGDSRYAIQSRLVGRFNVDNLLAVAGVLRASGLPAADVAAALAELQPVRGRMNRIDADAGAPLVVVDYAHTPDALEQALTSLRGHTRGRLVCVFGCGGERDRGKRPQMGRIAEELADAIVITDDNPRGENGDTIVAEIVAGLTMPQAAFVKRDRFDAIAAAIAAAGVDDTVLIAGKGHESYQDVGGVKLPFDDADAARRVLEARA